MRDLFVLGEGDGGGVEEEVREGEGERGVISDLGLHRERGGYEGFNRDSVGKDM